MKSNSFCLIRLVVPVSGTLLYNFFFLNPVWKLYEVRRKKKRIKNANDIQDK